MSTPSDLSSAVASTKTAASNAVANKEKQNQALQQQVADLTAQVAQLTAEKADLQTALDAAVAELATVTQELNAAFTFT